MPDFFYKFGLKTRTKFRSMAGDTNQFACNLVTPVVGSVNCLCENSHVYKYFFIYKFVYTNILACQVFAINHSRLFGRMSKVIDNFKLIFRGFGTKLFLKFDKNLKILDYSNGVTFCSALKKIYSMAVLWSTHYAHVL